MSSPSYSANNITVLKGLEAVRKRPGMYIGSTGPDGLHHLVYEVVDNSIDEAMAGHCDRILVVLEKNDIVRVEDNGRGIPVGIHPGEGVSALELVLTRLHAGGKFDKGTYKVSGGLHGVGVSVVNALSTWMEAYVSQDGYEHYQKFEIGIPVEPVKQLGVSDKRGTTIRWSADPLIFSETTTYNFDVLANRMRELAFLNSGITIILRDERLTNPKESVFKFEGGISHFVAYLNENKTVLHSQPVYITGERDDIIVEAALQYNDSFSEVMLSFVNDINTREGGTHLIGFKSALTKVLNEFFKNSKLAKKMEETLSGDDVREGLTAVLSVKVPEPQFEGQTKTKLGNTEVKGIVEGFVNDQLTLFFEQNPDVISLILEKSVLAAKARIAARQARDATRRKNAMDSTGLPGKLADCSEKDASKCEIYIVEGDS
ncbi:MAG: DNA topoisomerase IV subunit B, partial [Spirochaetaceae bacterium]|nr:DNA topoisomerase IV subunit B [Spirochaetaceae bacterium]